MKTPPKLWLVGASLVAAGAGTYFVWRAASVPASQRGQIGAAVEPSSSSDASGSQPDKPGTSASNTLAAAPVLPSSYVDPTLRDIAVLLKNLEGVKNPIDRENGLEALAAAMNPGRIASAVEFVHQSWNTPEGRHLIVRLLKHWAEKEPRTAAEWVRGASEGIVSQEGLNAVAIAWGTRNLTEALEWLRALPDKDRRNAAIIVVAYESAGSAPMEAFRIAEDLPDNDARDALITHTANQWAGKKPAEAIAWAEKVPDPELRQRLMAGVITVWAETDPAGAAKVAATLPAGRPQEDAVVGIVQRWVQKNPKEAAQWVLDFPDGPLQSTAAGEVVRLWAEQDEKAAGAWAGSLPASMRDHAVAAYVDKLVVSSPVSAAAWVDIIGDEELRARQKKMVVTAWKAIDPAAAKKWRAETSE
ncbi:MAG TPA: hypothetical protein VG796_01585 [Verrucomicrobiales bacterium]|nr:hypothetical protein [Verrucomicrobiales bacterium]